MANSFAPVQLLRTDWNPDIWTAFDNGTDQRTQFAITTNPSVLPADKEKYAIGCILIQQATASILLNVGTTDVPNWQPFGPGTNSLPTFVAGQYLTNDGSMAFWSLIDLATGVMGILDISHINMTQIEAYLLADNTWLTALATNTTFDTALANSTTFINQILANTAFTNALASYFSTNGLIAVVTDSTLTGNGTTSSPLHVVGGGVGNSAGPFGIYNFQTESNSAINPSLAQVIYDPGSQSIYTLGQIGINGTNESLVISRLQQDSVSGIWNVTSTATPTTGTTTWTNNGIFVNGSIVYVVYQDNINSNIKLGQYALDLTGFTTATITLAGTGNLTNNCIWTDGTDVWVFRDTHVYQHNITGNTNTTYTLSGFTAANIQTFIINGTTLYGMKDVNGVKTVMTASISGSVVTQTASYVLTAFDGTPVLGTQNIGSNIPCIYSQGANLQTIISYPVGAALQSASGSTPFFSSGVQYAKFASLTIPT